MKTCDICGENFENGRSYSNHVRWKHKLNKVKCRYCKEDFSCGIEQHENACMLNPENIKHCLQCGKQIVEFNKEFCNRSCATTYNNINKRIYIKGPKKKYKYINNKEYDCKCIICKKEFKHIGRKIKTCSKDCYRKLLSKQSKANPNCGGETNYKKYRYKGIYMDSTWELEIAKWMDKKKIKWERSRKLMFWWTDKEGKKRRYYPDFYLPKYDLYLDPKNKYLLEIDKFKLEQVIKENNINLIYGHKDLIIDKIGAQLRISGSPLQGD